MLRTIGLICIASLSYSLLVSPLFADEMITIGLASQNRIKSAAVGQAFQELFPEREIIIKNFPTNYPTPSQAVEKPVSQESGIHAAKNSLLQARKFSAAEPTQDPIDYWVSIESFIESKDSVEDSAITQTDQAIILVQKGDSPPVEEISPELSGESRKKTLQDALVRAIIKTEIEAYSDFPSEGVVFRDMSSLIAHPELRKSVIQLLARKFEKEEIDVIAGLDARGFILGALLADELKKPFLTVRKKGKLPNPSFTETYDTEYSKNNGLQISGRSLEEKAVLIVDDLLATGGTLKATENLFKKAGVKKVLSTCLIELKDLKGREKLGPHFFSLIQY